MDRRLMGVNMPTGHNVESNTVAASAPDHQLLATSLGPASSPKFKRSSIPRGQVKVTERSLRYLRRVVVPCCVIVAWVAVTSAHAISALFLPSPGDLLSSFQGMQVEYVAGLIASLERTALGYAIGLGIGSALGLFMAYSPVFRELFGGIFDFIRPVPIFALIPLFLLWFGIGNLPQVTLIALGTSVVMGVATLEAIYNVPPVFIRAAQSLGASRGRVYRTIIVPAITPHVLGAVRVAAALSWGLDVAAEFLGARVGIGYLMIVRESYLDTAGILDIVLTYAVLAYLADRLLQLGFRRLTKWTERESGTVRMVTSGTMLAKP